MTNLYVFATPDRFKFGIAKNVAKRMKVVGAHMPVQPVCLGSIPGSYPLERFVHKKLSAFRLQGEWFQANDHVREVAATLLDRGPDAIGFQPPPPKPKFVPDEVPQERRIAARKMALQAMWPDDTVGELAAFAEVSREEAEAWLEGKPMPRLVLYAIRGLMFPFFNGFGAESFK
jgi:hypothetical protein